MRRILDNRQWGLIAGAALALIIVAAAIWIWRATEPTNISAPEQGTETAPLQ